METETIIKSRYGLNLRVVSDDESLMRCKQSIGPGCVRTVAFAVVDQSSGIIYWMGCPAHIRQAGWFVDY